MSAHSPEPGACPRQFLALYPTSCGGFAVDFNDGIHWAKQSKAFKNRRDAEEFAAGLPQ